MMEEIQKKTKIRVAVIADNSQSMRFWGKYHVLNGICRMMDSLPGLFPGRFGCMEPEFYAWGAEVRPVGKNEYGIFELPAPRGRSSLPVLMDFMACGRDEGIRAFFVLTDGLFDADEASALRRHFRRSEFPLCVMSVGADCDEDLTSMLGRKRQFSSDEMLAAAETLLDIALDDPSEPTDAAKVIEAMDRAAVTVPGDGNYDDWD